MPLLKIKASTVVPAPADVVYELIADYHKGHPSILPPQYFENLQVVSGPGRGAGTRIVYTMKAFGSRETSHARITEPEPGKVLVETVEERPVTTTFTVESLPDGKSRVTFLTEYRTVGLRGWIETFLVPGFLRKVYAAELQQLAQRAVEASRASQRTT